MAQPFVGEIRMFAGNFADRRLGVLRRQAPARSARTRCCSRSSARRTAETASRRSRCPTCAGRVPIHQGNGFILAETGGAEEITLTVNQIAAHRHPLLATTAVANQSSPANNVLAQSTAADLYIEDTATAALATSAITRQAGASRTRTSSRTSCINFIISLFGIFPRFS